MSSPDALPRRYVVPSSKSMSRQASRELQPKISLILCGLGAAGPWCATSNYGTYDAGRSTRKNQLMNTDTIICPNCKTEIPLSQAVSQQLSEEFKQKWATEKKQLLEMERAQLKAELSEEVAELKERLEEQKGKVAAARANELKVLRLQRELEDQRQNLELEVAQKIAAERSKIQKQAGETAAEKQQLKIADRERTISDLRAQLAMLQQRLEQQSQQHQGEVLEVSAGRSSACGIPI